ncbi:hypothetical protein SAMN06265222_12911 [Neorhodopirellula lusitana]|uniref:LisH domain-containing protein n=1 Tax=Neorhodopirellula lusitana TaxID=445327 RepID=A0ABY1QSJ6_9BACT|nr:hypothetical protein SAMN06265222_12911 [Neorhodopirellula lusitana]
MPSNGVGENAIKSLVVCFLKEHRVQSIAAIEQVMDPSSFICSLWPAHRIDYGKF